MSAFLDVVHRIGPELAGRSGELDRSGAFVQESYRALREHKLFSAPVPSEQGGGGLSHAELCEVVRVLATYCPSSALAYSMHAHLVAAAVWRLKHGQPAAPLLTRIAAEELVLVSTGAGDWLDSAGKAERVDGGYRVTANKRFASGSPGADLALTSAPYDDPEAGPLVLHFALSLKAEGVRVGDDWDTVGMRATGSHTLRLENAFVPDAAISMKRPRGVWHPSYNVICTVALPIVTSAYMGVGETAAKLGREAAKPRASDPLVQLAVGEMESALAVAQMAYREMVARVGDYTFTPDAAEASMALIRKSLATEQLERCVEKACEVSGGAAFFRKHPLERLARDIKAMHFHPLPSRKQLMFTGRVALGLEPV